MRKLKDILNKVEAISIHGDLKIEVSAVNFDSRKVETGNLFVAQRGLSFDGHVFVEKAIESGAKSIICEDLPESLVEGITYVKVSDSNKALAVVASNFYNNPSSGLKLVGVTGTNGKTTIATLLYQLYESLGYKSGLLSTVKVLVGAKEYTATHTTPDSLQINKYLHQMIQEGVEYCFMEVSSHGIHQKRTEGLDFVGGVFTNLTHDHLDYHNNFKEYRDVKKSFFDSLPKRAFALVNLDDKNGEFMLQNSNAKKYTYALKTGANYKAKILENQFNGLLLNVEGNEVWSKLIGSFNAYNLLAVFGVSQILGVDKTASLVGISQLENVVGRFQYIVSKEGVNAIIDYAHTPDALKNVLETINDICSGNEQIITVVGCGGDRDKSKRPVMGHIASHQSSQVIFTSDNPRSENPTTIISEMEAGVEPQNIKKTLSIVDREQAIKTAIKFAKKGDIILIAGKGHETYQEVNGKRSYFDDFEKVTELFQTIEI